MTDVSSRQFAVLAALGIVVWFLVALLIRALEPSGALARPAVLLLYAAVIPATVPLVLAVRRAAGLRRDQTATGVLIATAAASLCDGHALVWWPSLYGGDAAAAGAAILWGVGVALLLSLRLSRA